MAPDAERVVIIILGVTGFDVGGGEGGGGTWWGGWGC